MITDNSSSFQWFPKFCPAVRKRNNANTRRKSVSRAKNPHTSRGNIFLELRRRGEAMFYYRTANGLEVDFLCRRDNRAAALIQTAWDMETMDTRKRELRALAKAMTELNLKEALVVTHDGEGEIPVNGGTVRLAGVRRLLLGRV